MTETLATNADFLAAAEAMPSILAATAFRHGEMLNGADIAPALIDSLPGVLALSDFVARTLRRYPHLLGNDPSLLAAARTGEALEQAVTALCAECQTTADLDVNLRQVRNTELARLAWRDIAGVANLDEVIATVSTLADSCIENTVNHHLRLRSERHGEPRREDGEPVGFVVLGLGKLGGRELNFSSDIDLIFAYEEEGETGGDQPLSHHEFFVRLGRDIIRSLDEVSDGGFVFRVDMRLRPNGRSGPLALSFDAMEHYYQTHGRDWERYALIKARPVGGSVSAGHRLLEILRPFVYRKYLDFSAFESIRGMKTLIENEQTRRRRGFDLKLGRGGIREIEFVVQSYQLIRGGREPELQTTSLHTALDYLVDSGVIPENHGMALHRCYDFLRRAEHRLQMMDDRQTQLIPDNDLDRQRLATGMALHDFSEFQSSLDDATGQVHSIFENVFTVNSDNDAPAQDPLLGVWNGTLDAAKGESILEGLGFEQPERTHALLLALYRGRVYQVMSSSGRERLDRLIPRVIRAAAAVENRDAALTRVLSIIEAIGQRPVYFSLLYEKPLALDQLMKLISASEWITKWVARYPVILDELIDPITGFAVPERAALVAEFDRRLTQRAQGDLEVGMDLLREMHHAHILRIAAADVAGLIPTETVSRSLCDVAEAVLETALKMSHESLLDNRRLDEARQRAWDGGFELGVVAYGKFGSHELGYNSDLDIVFVIDAPEGTEDTGGQAAYFFSRVVQRLVHILTTPTRAGMLYEIDMRLRPSGRAGTSVTPLAALASYQHDRAWTWEHQAIVRARVVAGPDSMAGHFEDIRRSILSAHRDAVELTTDVANMRERMINANCRTNETEVDIKLDRGGLVDIEFLVQYLVLRYGGDHPGIMEARDNRGILKSLVSHGLLDEHTGETLMHHYLALLETEQKLKLQEKPPLTPHNVLSRERREIEEIWDAFMQSG